MISISIEKDSNIIRELEVKGHAANGDQGNDLICCVVSTLSVNFANAVTDVVLANNTIEFENGYLHLIVNETDINKINSIKILTDAYLLSLKDVVEEHPDFINMKITEEIK